jgi:hypothetical protein
MLYMGLLDLTPELTKISKYTQKEFEEHLFRLGFRTQYGLNYWFVDVPCEFEKFLKVDVRISVGFYQHNDTLKVRLTPMHLQRGFEHKYQWGYLSGSMVWYDTSICHSPEEIEIEYLESLNTLMSEETAKSWFVKRVATGYIDFPDRTSFLLRYKTL